MAYLASPTDASCSAYTCPPRTRRNRSASSNQATAFDASCTPADPTPQHTHTAHVYLYLQKLLGTHLFLRADPALPGRGG
jgi:hypothetical protein